MAERKGQIYLGAMAALWLVFGVITIFYPPLMELFMTERGREADTAFSRQLWIHEGFDILAVALLLFILSRMTITAMTLRAAAAVVLFPTAAILYTIITTPFWSVAFLILAVVMVGLALYGFALARSASDAAARAT